MFGKSKAPQTIIDQDSETTHRAAKSIRDPGWKIARQATRREETMPAYLRKIDDDEPHGLWKLIFGKRQ